MNKGFGVAKKKPPRKKSKAVGFSYTGQLRPGTQTPRRSVSASRELEKKNSAEGVCRSFVSHRFVDGVGDDGVGGC